MVHTAVGFAKMANRLRTLACTSSIGPGATNMITGAALATINRLPVLLLPGDIFATRGPAPGAAAAGVSGSQDASVNDCFRPVSRYWDRINRPEQLITALPEAHARADVAGRDRRRHARLPQDVQAEAFDYPDALFDQRVWTIAAAASRRGAAAARGRADPRPPSAPLIVAGGGAIYSEATEALARFAQATGIPVVETKAGKGALPLRPPAGARRHGRDRHRRREPHRARGRPRHRRRLAAAAISPPRRRRRSSIRTSASSTSTSPRSTRQAPGAAARRRCPGHAGRMAGRCCGLAASRRLPASASPREGGMGRRGRRASMRRPAAAVMSQGEVIGIVNELTGPRDVIVCAAGSLPGDLHKLWRDARSQAAITWSTATPAWVRNRRRPRRQDGAPDRERLRAGRRRLVSDDGAGDRHRRSRRGVKLTVVLLDNQGFASIGGLSEPVGCAGSARAIAIATRETGQLDGDPVDVDFAANAASLGAHAIRACTPAADLTPRSRRPAAADGRPRHRRSRSTSSSGSPATSHGGTCRSPKSRRLKTCRRRARRMSGARQGGDGAFCGSRVSSFQ